jgi:hypothetical protein
VLQTGVLPPDVIKLKVTMSFEAGRTPTLLPAAVAKSRSTLAPEITVAGA